MLITNNMSISAERFGDEIVAIHFLKGTYFSIRGSAIALWDWLQLGVSQADLATMLSKRYGLSAEQGKSTVEVAISLFQQYELVVDDASVLSASDDYNTNAGPECFEEPMVEAFQDLQELIAIDPVHEVDPMQGWPHRPSPAHLD